MLGCGGTAAALAASGKAVTACILGSVAEARAARPASTELASDLEQAGRILGLKPPILGTFPNIRFNTVPHLDLVQFIERAIVQTQATTIFTHHPHDLNDDHRHTAAACQAAARRFQRTNDAPALGALYFMEVLSSTDWAFPAANVPFQPTAFFELGDAWLAKKLEALEAYRGVMRPYPHPRSVEAIHALAVLRGAQAGMRHAEAFQTAFQALSTQRVAH